MWRQYIIRQLHKSIPRDICLVILDYYLFEPFPDSKIVRNEDQFVMAELHSPDYMTSSWKLIFQNTKEDKKNVMFKWYHTLTDNLTILELENGVICGGYTTRSWKWPSSPSSALFYHKEEDSDAYIFFLRDSFGKRNPLKLDKPKENSIKTITKLDKREYFGPIWGAMEMAIWRGRDTDNWYLTLSLDDESVYTSSHGEFIEWWGKSGPLINSIIGMEIYARVTV